MAAKTYRDEVMDLVDGDDEKFACAVIPKIMEGKLPPLLNGRDRGKDPCLLDLYRHSNLCWIYNTVVIRALNRGFEILPLVLLDLIERRNEVVYITVRSCTLQIVRKWRHYYHFDRINARMLFSSMACRSSVKLFKELLKWHKRDELASVRDDIFSAMMYIGSAEKELKMARALLVATGDGWPCAGCALDKFAVTGDGGLMECAMKHGYPPDSDLYGKLSPCMQAIFRRWRAERGRAIMMGKHQRIGKSSPFILLDVFTLRQIVAFTYL